MKPMNEIVIYRNANNDVELDVNFEGETVWLTQAQMVALFDSSKANVSEHIKHIIGCEELEEEATVRKFRTVRKEGSREVSRNILHYNLDMVISVGYRVNSHRGIEFRKWATSKLRELLVQGYTLNEKRLAQKEQEIIMLKSGIQIISRAAKQKADAEGLDWLDTFATGLTLLDDYDHESLDRTGVSQEPANYPTLKEYYGLVETMRAEFDSGVFGKEKDDGFTSSIAQIAKGMGEVDFYPSLEEKAAMLLYLVTKNHSFVDGNKRIGAACFLLFLERNGILFPASSKPILSNEALAALTLYVASSKPDEMETVKRLIVSVLNRNQV